MNDTEDVVGKLATTFYGDPTSKLELVGVTGTNGKTTIATLLYNMFRKFGYKTGLISTVCNYIDEEAIPTEDYFYSGALCFIEWPELVEELLDEGYVTLSDGKYHYYLHQGNNRVVINQSGTVEETNHYYPFGGVFPSAANVT